MGPAKILSVGLEDLVSCREAALRTAGLEVVAALCLEDVARACTSCRFDVAIVGYAFSVLEKAQFVRCLQGVFRLPVILITGEASIWPRYAQTRMFPWTPLSETCFARYSSWRATNSHGGCGRINSKRLRLGLPRWLRFQQIKSAIGGHGLAGEMS